ncbi:MAG: type II secretion system protein GspG [Patescibacteria group bacterium]
MKHMNARGFTLVELLVVIAIIGILSTLAVAAVQFARGAAKIAQAKHDVDAIVLALKQLETDTGQWPRHQSVDAVTAVGTNEVWDLNASDAGIAATDGNFPNWNGPYMATVKRDPWGNHYFYDSDYILSGDTRVVVGSFGPNGVGQNVYDADNIIKYLR